MYADELLYRNEAKLYGHAREEVVTTRTNLSEFLAVIKQKVNAKSYENYVSKMRIFNSWLERNKLNELNIKILPIKTLLIFQYFYPKKS